MDEYYITQKLITGGVFINGQISVNLFQLNSAMCRPLMFAKLYSGAIGLIIDINAYKNIWQLWQDETRRPSDYIARQTT